MFWNLVDILEFVNLWFCDGLFGLNEGVNL